MLGGVTETAPSWEDEMASDWPQWSEPSNSSRRRGRPKRPAIVSERIVGRRAVKTLQRHLERLRETYPHPNRTLHYDQLVVALLLGFYNPTCRSLRTLDGLASVCQEQLQLPRLPKSTTSDAMALFDASLLSPLLEDLRNRVPALKRADADLDKILRDVLAADGSYFTICADVAWAIHLARSNGNDGAQIRLNFQLNVRTWVPGPCSVSGRQQGSETAAVAEQILPDVIYLFDRNFIDFDFLGTVLQKRSDFVVRCRTNAPNFQPIQDRPLSRKDRDHGVVSDRVGRLPGRRAPRQRLREVVITDPHTHKSIRVLTSLLDVPAHVIGLLYRHRWQIELFFRWLKVWGNFEHLISHSRNGLTLQFYVAVLGVLVMYIASGRRVSRYAYSLLGFVAAGMATLEDILPQLELRQREAELERQRRARKRAKKLGQ
jgi:hypothetical protein